MSSSEIDVPVEGQLDKCEGRQTVLFRTPDLTVKMLPLLLKSVNK